MKRLKEFFSAMAYFKAVGPNKPLGYLVNDDLKDGEYWEPSALKSALHKRGLETKIFPRVGEGMDLLAVFHRKALGDMLADKADVLGKYGWSSDVDSYVENVVRLNAVPKTDLFDLVSDTFGDKQNSGRTDRVVSEAVMKMYEAEVAAHPEKYVFPVSKPHNEP